MPGRSSTRTYRPPAGASDELFEVERAISVLHGRHPEHERAQRESIQAAKARRQSLAGELRRGSRRRVRRALVCTIAVAAAVCAGTVGWLIAKRARAFRAALSAVESAGRYGEDGWASVESNILTATPRIEADVDGPGCYVAVAAADAPLVVDAGGRTSKGVGSVGWCGCTREHVTVAGSTSAGAAVPLELLRGDPTRVGGPLARPWWRSSPRAWGGGGDACADAQLDAWIDARSWPDERAAASWVAQAPFWPVLRGEGFRPIAGVPRARPFARVTSAAGECVVAVARERERVWLRARGGRTLADGPDGAVAWCSASARALTVWRDGASDVAVVAAPSDRMGGSWGTRERVAAAGVPLTERAAWVPDEDGAWDTAAFLRASVAGAAGAHIVATPVPLQPGALEHGLAAIALAAGARVEAYPPTALVACDSSLDGDGPRVALCAPAEAATWWRRGDSPAFVARADLPFWAAPLVAEDHADSARSLLALLRLARRLVTGGFQPTILEGVVELPDGVRVVGRAGEDAVVAVGLAHRFPWVFPYAAPQSPRWTLDDAPQVVPLRPGQSAFLTARPAPTAPLEERRTVVFRRVIRDTP